MFRELWEAVANVFTRDNDGCENGGKKNKGKKKMVRWQHGVKQWQLKKENG